MTLSRRIPDPVSWTLLPSFGSSDGDQTNPIFRPGHLAKPQDAVRAPVKDPVSYTHLTLPTKGIV